MNKLEGWPRCVAALLVPACLPPSAPACAPHPPYLLELDGSMERAHSDLSNLSSQAAAGAAVVAPRARTLLLPREPLPALPHPQPHTFAHCSGCARPRRTKAGSASMSARVCVCLRCPRAMPTRCARSLRAQRGQACLCRDPGARACRHWVSEFVSVM